MSNHKTCKAQGCRRPVPDSRRWDAEFCNPRCKGRMAARRWRRRLAVARKRQARKENADA